jgi:hypothetical protein
MIDIDKLYGLLDHLELVNWIHLSSYHAAKIGKKIVNYDGREFIELPSGKKVKITIKVEEIEEG